jgi:hypothetical protein
MNMKMQSSVTYLLLSLMSAIAINNRVLNTSAMRSAMARKIAAMIPE